MCRKLFVHVTKIRAVGVESLRADEPTGDWTEKQMAARTDGPTNRET